MNKSDVVKQWKPELLASGFIYKGNMFRYDQTEDHHLKFGISVLKNVHGDTFKINPTILIRSPFVASPEELLLMGNVRRDGVHLHVLKDSWWPGDALPQALDAVKKFALAWFERHGKPEYLAEMLEKAIRQKKDLINVIEPLDESSTCLPWPQSQGTPVIASRVYGWTSVMHYLNGNRQMAIERTRDWLNSLRPNDPDRAKASAQLQALSPPS